MVFEIVIPSLYLLAGIMAYAAIHHLFIALQSSHNHMQLLFGVLCLLTVPLAIFHAQSLQATNVLDFVSTLKWNLSFTFLFFLLFPWVIALYTGVARLPFLAGLNVLFAALFVINLIQPFSLLYNHIYGIGTMDLPWGESIMRVNGQKSDWIYIAITSILAVFSYVLYALRSLYYRYRRRTDLYMTVAIGLCLFSTLEGILSRVSVIELIELSPLGLLVMMIVISMVLTSEMQQRLLTSERNFRSLFENSPVGISLSRNGYTLEVNEAYLRMFGFDKLAEVRGSPVINRIAPQSRAEVEERIRLSIQGYPTEDTYETTGLRKDGSQFPLFVSAKRVVLNDAPLGFAFLIDITEHVQNQQTIERISKLYKMLSEINSANLHIQEREQLFEAACHIAVRSGLVRMSWIGLLDRDSGDVVPVTQAGHVEGYLDKLKINIFNNVSGNGPTGIAIKSGTYVVCNDIGSDPRLAPWRDEALKRGYRASIVFPLTQSGHIIGAFSMYFHDAGSLTKDVIQLLVSLVEDISFTLNFIEESARREQAQNGLRELSTFLQSALENERKRIARELHDELGQTMTALHFDLKWLHERIDTQQHEVQGRLRSMQTLLERTVSTVRRISDDLRPGMLDDLGLAAAIEHYAENFAVRTGIACDLVMNMTEFDLSDEAATALFRIVQESLTNVARHSSANHAIIRMQDMEDNILLIVQDNGRGLPSDLSSGRKTYGLMGMRERVRILEGTIDIFNEAGAGLRIEVFIPKHSAIRAQL